MNACGPWAAELALMAGIGRSDQSCHIMRTKLPVEPRLRSVFVFKCPTDLPNCPLAIDRNLYWRRESTGTFLAGYVPSKVRGALRVSLFHSFCLYVYTVKGG